MKEIPNFADISTGNFSVLPAGGYILKILSAEDKPDREYFEIIYDIADGPEAGRYSDEWGKEHPYAHKFVRSYKEKALSMFKGFITALEESQPVALTTKVVDGSLTGKDLEGLKFGAVIGYEEYESDRGEVKTRPYIAQTRSCEAIKSGNFKVPEIKKLKKQESSDFGKQDGFTPLTDTDLPF